MKYVSTELHCHTLNSDGKFTVQELVEDIKSMNIKCMAITDHNTQSAYFDDYLKNDIGITILKSIEWTTFFGHVLVLGADKFVDWRYAQINTIDKFLSELKQCNAVIGVAHPYQQGSPLCTGCHFDFNIENWGNIDYIEVWSREFPMNELKNQRAYALWLKKLGEGNKIAALSGRDLHSKQPNTYNFGTTYLGIEGKITQQKMKDAILNGRVYVTLGPQLDIKIEQNGEKYELGSSLNNSPINIDLNIDLNKNSYLWEQFSIKPNQIKVLNNSTYILSTDKSSFTIKPEKGFVIFEVYGEHNTESGKLLAFTSPIYIL